ncbi:hypothetical protein KAR10_09875 [bacterium]|nr:hypothetical protein [bacterium]
MAFTFSNHYKAEAFKGNVDVENDTLKVILMATGFTFNADNDANYDDVSGSELSAGNGYTAGGETWTNVSVAEDDGNNRGEVTGDNVQWSASGGSIGPSPGFLVYKDTGTPSTSTVIGYGTFTGGDQTAGDGTNFTISGITLRMT